MKQLVISLKTPRRAAVVEDGRLEELFVRNEDDTVGNIYHGLVVRIEPSLNAAFVDIGSEGAAFLGIDDVLVTSNSDKAPPNSPATPPGAAGRSPSRPSIGDLLRPGHDLMVQVNKAARKQRGASVSTRLSMAGRYVVMTNVEGVAISQKISGQKERQRLTHMVRKTTLPPGSGIIVRESAVDRSAQDIESDLANLRQLWQGMFNRFEHPLGKAPEILFDGSDLVGRMMRDVCDDSFEELWVDDADALSRAEGLSRRLTPHRSLRFELYQGPTPLFTHLGIQQQVLDLSKREVDLSDGAKLVIDHTQALTAIDVVPGRPRLAMGLEEQRLGTNLEAASEIARQLRLRNVNGIAVIDFVDLPGQHQRRKLELSLKEATKRDAGTVTLLPMSAFGLIELARKGVASSSTESDEGIGSDAAIFVSYRREDTEHQVGRIHDWLARHFGQGNIFYDVETIPIGVDWWRYLEASVRKCTVLLAPIGDLWLEELKRPRTDIDIMRFEIEVALRRTIPIIPLLVAKAGMPTTKQLPESMQRLVVHNGIPIRPGRDFESDMMRLIRILQELGISELKEG